MESKQKDEKINRAMAEVAGWTEVTTTSIQEHRLKTWSAVLVGRPPCSISNQDRVPNYLTDLNAVHEVEKILNEDQHRHYRFNLIEVVGTESKFHRATARQRCEALLRTLNKWNPEWN
jgi:hypothetical protein